jgi:hypothetical protein
LTKQAKLTYEYLDEIQPAEVNPKDHDLGAIMESMRRFGFVAPLVVNTTTGNLVVGHGRAKALQQLVEEGEQPPNRITVDKAKRWKVPVVNVEFASDEEARAYLVADNRLTELGGWNYDELAQVLTGLGDNLVGTGYDGEDLDDVLAMVGQLPPPPGGTGPGAGESGDALWPTVKLRVPPEVFHQYRKLMATCDGNTDGEKFADLLGRVS